MDYLTTIEDQVLKQPPLLNKLVKSNLGDLDLKNCGYEKHVGIRPFSTHWRKAQGNGCFHITCDKNNVLRMHRDSFDPRKYPIMHFFEVVYYYLRHPLMYLKQE